ncbi:MAG: sulfite exporter TauE/SafE family protein [Coraliomargarita sp.]|nr:sulfite exporter TauE/SafE family protein [Coraliomargarita sp.]
MFVLLPILFASVSWLYAMAGFGGGSTYIALLAVSGLPLTAVPVVALSCNFIVSGQGSIALIKRGHARRSILLPLLVGSIPAAFLGGAWRLPQSAFIGILAAALSVAGVAMLVQRKFSKPNERVVQAPPAVRLFGVGIALGLLAGITGIGGGIYLAPVMHLLGWSRAQTIAACTSIFIGLNSMAGLTGHLTKGTDFVGTLPLMVLIACPIAVSVGGGLGTYFLTNKLPQERIRVITAAVILLVAARLWMRVLFA